MKIIEPSFEMLTPFSEGGIEELQLIEKVARTCYKSEDNITEDGESAKKFVQTLVKRGHEAPIEFSFAAVKIVCDRGIANEIVRHRLFSYAQESTRYCNYSKGEFSSEITVIRPSMLGKAPLPMLLGRPRASRRRLHIFSCSMPGRRPRLRAMFFL